MKEKTIKLEVGQEFKSYGDMMDYFGWKKKGGDSKKAQMKMIESYLDLEKVGRYGLKITEIKKDVPKAEPAKEIGKKATYLEYMKPIILNTLANGYRADHCIICTKVDFLQKTAIVNEDYKYWRMNSEKASKELGIPKDVLDYFFNATYDNSAGSIETVLNNLKRDSYLTWSIDWVIKKESEKLERPANNEEKEIITQAQRDVLDELGCRNTAEVHFKNKQREYTKKFGEKCKVKGIEYGYLGYIIISTKQLDEMALEVKEEKDLLSKINEISYDKALMTGSNKQEQLKKEYRELQERMSHILGRPKESDKKQNKILTELMISDSYNCWGKAYADRYIKLKPSEE